MGEIELIDPDRHWLPKRIRPCPVCGDRDRVHRVVWGMPAGMPPEHLADRVYFAGCVIGDESGNWYCPVDARADQLIAAANAAGGPDNISVVVVDVIEESSPPTDSVST